MLGGLREQVPDIVRWPRAYLFLFAEVPRIQRHVQVLPRVRRKADLQKHLLLILNPLRRIWF